MSRSTQKSLRIPHAIRDGLKAQLDGGILNYPSENSAWIGLARYQLLIGKPHPITEAIARMHPEDQDLIDDFLCYLAEEGHSLKGQYLERLVKEAVGEMEDPTSQDLNEVLPQELLKKARAWREA